MGYLLFIVIVMAVGYAVYTKVTAPKSSKSSRPVRTSAPRGDRPNDSRDD